MMAQVHEVTTTTIKVCIYSRVVVREEQSYWSNVTSFCAMVISSLDISMYQSNTNLWFHTLCWLMETADAQEIKWDAKRVNLFVCIFTRRMCVHHSEDFGLPLFLARSDLEMNNTCKRVAVRWYLLQSKHRKTVVVYPPSCAPEP